MPSQPSSSSAACAATIPAPVSLSESELEEDALADIVDAFVIPQWSDNSRVVALTNTLTALTLAGVLVTDTSMEEVVVSLRRIVVVTSAPAEAEVDFTLIPRNRLRPRVFDLPTGESENATFEVELQDRELSRLGA